MDEVQQPSRQQGVEVAQAAGVIALGNVASRVLGLVSEIVKSGLFGAGGDMSAWNVAFRIPSMIYDLLVGGMLSSALIPVLSDYASPERRSELWRLLSILISMAAVVLCIFILAGELLAPQVVWMLASGLSPAYQGLAVSLLRLSLPAVLFLCVASILSGALYALKRFTFPAFTAAIFNAALVLVALALGWRWGVRALAAGMLTGAALQILFQLPGLRTARLRPSLDMRHPALRRIGKLYLPIMLGLVVDYIAVSLSYRLASHINDSAISWMEYAAKIIQLPLGLVVTAVSIAILPTLSRQAAAEEIVPFRSTLTQGLRLVLVLVIPATVGLYALAHPLVALILEHGGRFTPLDTASTAQALRCALLGLLAAAIDQPLIFAFYARKDTLTPALVGVGTTVLYVALALPLQWLGILTLPLLVMVNSLKLTAHAVTMLTLTKRRLGGLGDHGLWGLALKSLGASAAMGALVHITASALAPLVPVGLGGEVLLVGMPGLTGLVAYGTLAVLLQIEEVKLLRGAFLGQVKKS